MPKAKDETDNQRGTIKDLKLLIPYFQPMKQKFFLAVGLMVVASAISIVLPLLIRTAIDVHIANKDPRGLLLLLAAAAGLASLMSLATSIRARFMAEVGQESIRQVRNDLFAKIQILPVKFFDHIPVGKLITRLTSDVDALSELVGNAIVSMIIDSIKLVGFLALMFWLDWRLTLVTLACLPILSFAMTFLTAKIGAAEDREREQASVVNANLQESISGIKIIQAFQAQDFFAEKFATRNKDLLHAALKATKVYGLFWPTVDFNWLISSAAIVFFGGRWVLDGTATIGTLVAFIAYSGQFFGPLRGLSQANRIIQRALAGAVRINQIFTHETETEHKLPPMPAIKGRVEFTDVTFGYNEGEAVLENINFAADIGETIALVGHTGAGKTSIINVLCRFYPVMAGKIRVDGLDIYQYDLETYRSQIGLVLQEPFLFSGSLRDNLLFGNPKANDQQIWEALNTVGLTEPFAKHNITLDTILTERGANFSTGQRQLISFARALISDPRILILDEATAHVDTLTEQNIQQATTKLLANRTSFVIAHRLSTIRNADKILVIDDGQIVESGSHLQLLAAKGEYWQLCTSQLQDQSC